MLLSEEIEIGINDKNYQYYLDKGYLIETYYYKKKNHIRRGTKLLVKIKDLRETSNEKVLIKCDYCGKEYMVCYISYIEGRKYIIKKDACCKCSYIKRKEGNLLKYGTNSMVELSKIKQFHLGRNKKYSKEDIINEFEKKGLIVQLNLLNKDEIIVKDKIPYICNNHKDKGIQYANYEDMKKRKYCCPYGAAEWRSISQSQSSIEDVKHLCDQRGYILLTESIRNVDDTVQYICFKHPDYGIQTTSLWGLKHSNNSCRMCVHMLLSGENHWHWRGGIALERDCIMNTFEYRRWRNSVFERDNYTCQCCGKRGGKLNAHHKENFSTHIELRLDIDNGLTLCEDCHSTSVPGSFHSVYGTHNNSKEQLDEYIKNYKLLKLKCL